MPQGSGELCLLQRFAKEVMVGDAQKNAHVLKEILDKLQCKAESAVTQNQNPLVQTLTQLLAPTRQRRRKKLQIERTMRKVLIQAAPWDPLGHWQAAGVDMS